MHANQCEPALAPRAQRTLTECPREPKRSHALHTCEHSNTLRSAPPVCTACARALNIHAHYMYACTETHTHALELRHALLREAHMSGCRGTRRSKSEQYLFTFQSAVLVKHFLKISVCAEMRCVTSQTVSKQNKLPEFWKVN